MVKPVVTQQQQANRNRRRYNLRSLDRINYSIHAISKQKEEDKPTSSSNKHKKEFKNSEAQENDHFNVDASSSASTITQTQQLEAISTIAIKKGLKRKRSYSTQDNEDLARERYCKRKNKENQLSTNSSNALVKPKIDELPCYVNQLPIHILALIFRKMEIVDRLRSEIVCKKWKRVSILYGWRFTRHICLGTVFARRQEYVTSQTINNSHISVILRRAGKQLKEIDIASFKSLDRTKLDHKIAYSLECAPNIHYLNLETIQLTNSTLALIGRSLPHLKSVNFRQCFVFTQVERGLTHFFTSCTQLEELNLSQNGYLDGSSFEFIPNTIRKLEMERCYGIGQKAAQWLRTKAPDLLVLDISGAELFGATLFKQLVLNMQKLQSLRFSEVYSTLEDLGFVGNFLDFAHNGGMLNLTELYVNDNCLVNDNALQAVSIGCRGLKVIDISHCVRHVTDNGIHHLSNLPRLEELKLTNLKMLTDNTLLAIIARQKLQKLSVSRCTGISDNSIIPLIKRCKLLQSLDVSHCTRVTNDSLKALESVMNHRYGADIKPNEDKDRFEFVVIQSGIRAKTSNPWIKLTDLPPSMQ